MTNYRAISILNSWVDGTIEPVRVNVENGSGLVVDSIFSSKRASLRKDILKLNKKIGKCQVRKTIETFNRMYKYSINSTMLSADHRSNLWYPTMMNSVESIINPDLTNNIISILNELIRCAQDPNVKTLHKIQSLCNIVYPLTPTDLSETFIPNYKGCTTSYYSSIFNENYDATNVLYSCANAYDRHLVMSNLLTMFEIGSKEISRKVVESTMDINIITSYLRIVIDHVTYTQLKNFERIITLVGKL